MKRENWIILAALLLSSCSSRVAQVELPAKYQNEASVVLNVEAIDVVSAFDKGPHTSRYQDIFFREVERWVKDRFAAGGGKGKASIKIMELDLIEKPLPSSGKNIFANRKDSYEAHLKVHVSVLDDYGFEKIYTEHAIKRSVVVSSTASLIERENEIKNLIISSIQQLDARLVTNVKEYLGNVIIR